MVASVAPLVSVHWPLYTVFPASAALFYALYFVGFERFSASCLAEKYDKFSWLNKRIWRQNLCALVHTYALVIVMIVVLARSHAQLQTALLYPHYDVLAYCAVSFSMGYMCLTLPWSLRHYFGSETERRGTRPTLIIHHAFVVLAHLVYLLTQTSPWPGALSLIVFEWSNLHLMPHHLMTQWGYRGKWHVYNGVAFFLFCTFVRVIGAMVLGAFYIRDIVAFRPHAVLGAANAAGAWVSVLLSLTAYLVILALSIYWYVMEVLSEVHKEFKQIFGPKWYLCGCLCAAKGGAAAATYDKTAAAKTVSAV